MRTQPRPGYVVVTTPSCIVCGEEGMVEMPEEAYRRWAGEGWHIQRAWPGGSADQREQLINGTHGECFDRLFPPDEED